MGNQYSCTEVPSYDCCNQEAARKRHEDALYSLSQRIVRVCYCTCCVCPDNQAYVYGLDSIWASKPLLAPKKSTKMDGCKDHRRYNPNCEPCELVQK